MRMLVLGATGSIGRRVSAELARHPDVDRVVLSARGAEDLERFAGLFGGKDRRVLPHRLDVTDDDALRAAMRDADVVVSCAGPSYLLEIDCVRAAIDSRVHYVSLCDDHVVTDRVMALDDDARDAGITVISGCGLSPGLTNHLVSRARRELDENDEIEISVAASSVDAGGEAAAIHFLFELSQDAPVLADGRRTALRAGSAPKLVYFPEPVGWVETFRCGHPEVITLAETSPGLRACEFRVGLTEKPIMDIARASAALGLGGTERTRRMSYRFAEPLRPLIEKIPPRGASWTAARVDVRGKKDGRPTTESLAVVDRLANLAAAPLVLAALALARGEVHERGVRTPEAAFDAGDFLAALAQRGLRVARLEPQLV
ncbi:MAG: saccharopine dehydrogenase NADP-binding domain-containing protein [Actinomycetota bacterium]|nr:saccharopine dehydrogenase NADP-binding domain-containing protein [Actinomycetota bacterium]